MTKLSVSKLPEAMIPTIILLSFCVGVMVATLTQNIAWQFAFSAISLIGFAWLILFKYKLSFALLALSIGVLFTNFFVFLSSDQAKPGCFDAKVSSPAKKFKKGFLYQINTSDNSVVIFSDSDQFAVLDKIHLCLKEEMKLEVKDQNYVLSQFKRKHIYLIGDSSLVSEGRGIRRAMYNLSLTIRAGIGRIYSGDKGTLAYGLLFGSSGAFSQEMKADLKRSGTTHLVAVSGYNVSIITSWLFSSLRYVSKNFAGISSVIVLLLFYFLTNGSASVLRASIMGVFVLLSRFIGRKVMPLHLLTLAATAIFLMNPFAIYDWGFQLSFLATAGLFFLSPPLETIFSFGRFKSILIKVFAETLGAQIFVLPILAINFGQFSLIGPLSNLFILPFISLAMLLVALSILGFFIYPILGIFFGGLASIILSYIMAVIKISSQVSFASVNLKINSAAALIIGYILVIVLTVLLRRFSAKREV